MRPTSLLVAVLVALGVLATAPASARADEPPSTGGASPTAPRTFEVVAHRGATGPHRTENGLRALRHAAALGADRVEIDVRPTADGRLVVMHDALLNRTTSCRGPVFARTLARIERSCRLRDGTEVPSLAAYVTEAHRLGVGLLIELKRAPGWRRATWRYLRAALDGLDRPDQARLLSFNPALLHRAKKAVRGVPRIWIAHRFRPSVRQVARTADGVSLDARFVTPRLVRALRAADLLALGQMSNRPADWLRYLQAGVDGSSTDRTATLVRWWHRRQPVAD
ncbi:glycerophosphodiester phosphodiesterase [Nocardioides nitrophenolicus]|uniref:glycerophosphodiester phosphodiesterase n=1 Tax=Nocardioides nitrophenolicus TaxID=60489 RepID=UPI00195894E5|nr:glycerophosphodiester phosphodiesterase family protein [Nocardioides nitrophenolicus]MBM7515920.1 glycerophosphoryl diester phosphodiesterase [Nocardioides nitrophenolicus]